MSTCARRDPADGRRLLVELTDKGRGAAGGAVQAGEQITEHGIGNGINIVTTIAESQNAWRSKPKAMKY